MISTPVKAGNNSTPSVEGNPVRNVMLIELPPQECSALFSQLTFVELRTHDIL